MDQNNTTKDDVKPNPEQFIISRKRKLYKFAAFNQLDNCFAESEWSGQLSKLLNSADNITVEIGAGTALFLTKLAKLNPDRCFVAIDRKSDRLYTGAKRAKEENMNNINYLWSNAHSLTSLLSPSSVDEIWITFPDPWPQDSNVKHRLTNKRFLSSYRKILKPSGKLNFKTDNRALFDWSLTQFDDNWKIEQFTHDLHNNNDVSSDSKITTTYEDRYLLEGNKINYLLARPANQ